MHPRIILTYIPNQPFKNIATEVRGIVVIKVLQLNRRGLIEHLSNA